MNSRGILLGATALLLSVNANAGEAETAFTDELHQCAAYYDIGAQTVTAMDAPQMAAVGERLQQQGKQAAAIASKYESNTAEAVEKTKETLMASTGGQGMGALMKRYKDKCQEILANPEQRLNYWIMAKM